MFPLLNTEAYFRCKIKKPMSVITTFAYIIYTKASFTTRIVYMCAQKGVNKNLKKKYQMTIIQEHYYPVMNNQVSFWWAMIMLRRRNELKMIFIFFCFFLQKSHSQKRIKIYICTNIVCCACRPMEVLLIAWLMLTTRPYCW